MSGSMLNSEKPAADKKISTENNIRFPKFCSGHLHGTQYRRYAAQRHTNCVETWERLNSVWNSEKRSKYRC